MQNIKMYSPQLAPRDVPASNNDHPQVKERLFMDPFLGYPEWRSGLGNGSTEDREGLCLSGQGVLRRRGLDLLV